MGKIWKFITRPLFNLKRIVSPPIYVSVKTHSHQYYSETVGELLLSTHGVESYDGKYMQVPALLIKTKDGIAFTKLEKQHYYTEVDFITPEEYEQRSGY